MDENNKDLGAGVAIGALSAARNKKLVALVGAALLVAGVTGFIVVGSEGIRTITTGGYSSPEQGKAIQLTEYGYLFTFVAGLFLIVYSLVGIQRDKAKSRQSEKTDATRL